MSDEQQVSREELDEMSKKELKALCKEQGLSVSGNIETLKARLLGEEEPTAPERKKARVLSSNLIIREISVKNGNIVYGVAGEVVVEMNDEKGEYMSKGTGTPLEVELK